jgi:hypothetical protein
MGLAPRRSNARGPKSAHHTSGIRRPREGSQGAAEPPHQATTPNHEKKEQNDENGRTADKPA